MSNKVLNGAKLRCDKGSTTSNLNVLSQQLVKIEGKLVATEMDFNIGVNILPFGVCSLTQKSCVTSTTKWVKTNNTHLINTQSVLLSESVCSCTIGGTIKPVHTNYNGFVSHKT